MRKLIALALMGLASLVLAPTALAAGPHHPKGEWANFSDCPLSRSTLENCVYSVTTGGTFTLGKKVVPIKNPVTLQGGFEGSGNEIKFYGAEDGNTLSKTPQAVPGGLAGLVKCNEIKNVLLRLSCEAVFQNGLTGVNATLELAAPATQIQLSTENLIFEEGTALRLPVKVHLENPFLGSGCYVGSSASPLIIPLTTGTSGKLKGKAGEISFNELFDKTTVKGSVLVNSTFTAPSSSGCAGAGAELLIDPIINAMVGLPNGAGSNSAVLEANFENGAAESVRASEK
jgi:hypothetical protein